MWRQVVVAVCGAWAMAASASAQVEAVPNFSSPSASCLSAEATSRQLRQQDDTQWSRASVSSLPVPAEYRAALARLVAVSRLPAKTRVRLVAADSGRDAWVLSSGVLFLSTRLWKGPDRLELDEVAAVLAHELAHLEAMDSRKRLCEVLALVGDASLAPPTALQGLQYAVQAGGGQLAIDMMRSNHLRELRADRRGAELLVAAGFGAQAMPRMLVKVTSQPGDYTGSHPALEHRLANLSAAVGD